MDDKDFFAKLAGVGPDGKFSSFSYTQKKANEKNQIGENGKKNQKEIQEERQGEKIQSISSIQPVQSKKIESEEIKQEKDLNVVEDNNEIEGQLAVDVYETSINFVLEAPVAGVKGEDIDVAITLDSITIRGQRSKDGGAAIGVGEKKYLYAECFWGKFTRTVSFSQEIDADRASASFRNGVLRVVLPKIQRDKPKKVKVRFE